MGTVIFLFSRLFFWRWQSHIVARTGPVSIALNSEASMTIKIITANVATGVSVLERKSQGHPVVRRGCCK
jgi:hypothetical protein